MVLIDTLSNNIEAVYGLYAEAESSGLMDSIRTFYHDATEILESWGYIGLFLATFLAATIVPFPSELVFIFCITQLNPVLCILVATAGNTLGALTLYWMGTLGKLRWLCTYGRIPPQKLHRFSQKARKWGPPLAIISFLPALGQVIVICLGLLRCDLSKTTLFIILGKGGRYIVVATLVYLAMTAGETVLNEM